MPRWNYGGVVVVLYGADHPPLHVHVFKDGRRLGKFDVENRRWMEGPHPHADQARKAIRQWLRDHGGEV